MKPCYEVELKIAQASEGCDVQLEFHEWQGEYMTVPPLCLRYYPPIVISMMCISTECFVYGKEKKVNIDLIVTINLSCTNYHDTIRVNMICNYCSD